MIDELTDILGGFVGLTFRLSGETESGLYVDRLPDISDDSLRQILPDDKGEAEAWADIEQRGIRRFYSMFLRELNLTHHVADTAEALCLLGKYREQLAAPLQMMLGAELMHERATSPRLNVYTTLDGRAKASEAEQELSRRAEDELSDAVRSIDVHSSGCFSSDGPRAAGLITFTTPTI